MTWFRCQNGNGGGSSGGYEYDVIKEFTLISDSSGNKTITFNDIRSYAYVYIVISESQDATWYSNSTDHARILPIITSQLGTNTKSCTVGYLWDSGNVSITFTNSSLTCNSYSNPYHNMYAKIIGSNTPLFG